MGVNKIERTARYGNKIFIPSGFLGTRTKKTEIILEPIVDGQRIEHEGVFTLTDNAPTNEAAVTPKEQRIEYESVSTLPDNTPTDKATVTPKGRKIKDNE